jgi:hypothetical protein
LQFSFFDDLVDRLAIREVLVVAGELVGGRHICGRE